MTTKECENRNNAVLKNLVYYGDIDNDEDLLIACALLDVKPTYTAYRNFESMENWQPKCYGAFKTVMSTVDKLYKQAMILKLQMEKNHIEIV